MSNEIGQVEHELISTSLDVEQLDNLLFRSKSLHVPYRARGVFGGQVISQAVVSATQTVDAGYGLHSLHCYFLLSASHALPILYYVQVIRDGRSYATRMVKAVQRGKAIFIMMCSFQKPEPEQPMHQWSMPSTVPHPDTLETDIEYYLKWSKSPDVNERGRKILAEIAHERTKSPLQIKLCPSTELPDGTLVYTHWMKTRNVAKFEPAFQKCILAYMSDMNFIPAARRSLGLKRFTKGPQGEGMLASLDHIIFFYDDNFDCSDWILYVVTSPRTGSGRGVVHGRMYTQSGTLVAITTQEGVVRADISPPSTEPTKAKL